MASPSAGAPALKYGDVNTETTYPGEVKGLIIFKNLHNNIQNDNYNMIKKLIIKLNDFEINLDNKVNIINLIFYFLNF